MPDNSVNDNMISKEEIPVYKNKQATVPQRVEDLLLRMTLDEKIAQIGGLWQSKLAKMCDACGNFDEKKAAQHFPIGLGQIGRPSEGIDPKNSQNRNAREMAEFTNDIQRYFVEKTRLGIPVMFHEECLHGLMAFGGTHLPVPIALACTFDDAFVQEVCTMVALEARSRGVHQALTPVVDVAREPRWGRFEETFGEDPYLVSRMGVAVVKGLQGDGDTIDNCHVMATLKHFAAHGQPESGMNASPANYSERLLREVFLSPFKACICEANAHNVMASYNEIDGVPSHANRWLLQDVLRKEWGFKGVVVADYFGVEQLYERHCVAKDIPDAACAAITAGVDIELPEPVGYSTLKSSIIQNKLAIDVLDTAVARILRAKFLLGLFETPYVDPHTAEKISKNTRNSQLARLAADKAIVLLKNDNNLLPLRLENYKSIGVIGPNANKVLLGGYSDRPKDPVTVLQGIKKRVQGNVDIVYCEGCRITEPGGGWHVDNVVLPNPDEDEKRMCEAIESAKTCDVIILALGGNEEVSREAYVEHHLGDAASLELLGNQNELTKRLLALGKPLVVVLLHGRPQSINYVNENVPAILDCWYCGEEAGNAVAGVLFGDTNPGGKLAASVPRSVGHLPAFYNHKPNARRGFLFNDVSPLFAFGYGLSFTTFAIGKPQLTKAIIKDDESTSVNVDITNTGSMVGDEVVQLYIRDCVSSVTRPVKELKGFKRISLAPGETKNVSLDITPEKLSFYDSAMNFVVEPGEFEIMIGSSSRDEDLQTVVLTVVK